MLMAASECVYACVTLTGTANGKPDRCLVNVIHRWTEDKDGSITER